MEKDKHMNKNEEETHNETSQDKLIERLIARIKNPSGRKMTELTANRRKKTQQMKTHAAVKKNPKNKKSET